MKEILTAHGLAGKLEKMRNNVNFNSRNYNDVKEAHKVVRELEQYFFNLSTKQE